jgi:hypothetical protein
MVWAMIQSVEQATAPKRLTLGSDANLIQSPFEFTIRSPPLRDDPRHVCHVHIPHPGSVVSPDHLGIGVA